MNGALEPVGLASDPAFYVAGKDLPLVEVGAIDGLRLPHPIMNRTLLPGPKASVSEWHLKEGDSFKRSKSSAEFINYVVRGNVSVSLANQSYEAGQGDAWTGAPGIEITVDALTDCLLLEWMSPPQLASGDQLITAWAASSPSSAHLFTRWEAAESFILHSVEGNTDFGKDTEDLEHEIRVLVPGPVGSLLWNKHRLGKRSVHAHGHYWATYLIRGSIEQRFGGTQVNLAGPGDLWAGGPGAVHSNEALSDVEVVEFKWPPPLMTRGVIQSWG